MKEKRAVVVFSSRATSMPSYEPSFVRKEFGVEGMWRLVVEVPREPNTP